MQWICSFLRIYYPHCLLQNKRCAGLKQDIAGISNKVEESQKIMTLILAKFNQIDLPPPPPGNASLHQQDVSQDVNSPTHQQDVDAFTRQQDVNTSTCQQDVDSSIRQQDVNASTRQQDVSASTLQQDVDAFTCQQDVDTSTRQQDVSASTRQQDVDAFTLQQDVNASTCQQDVNINQPSSTAEIYMHRQETFNGDDRSDTFNDSLSDELPGRVIEIETTGGSGILPLTKLMEIKRGSCSRKNFASKLNAELFDIETRKKSNIAGKKNKLKLNPVLVDYIRSAVFQYWPLEGNERFETEWRACHIAIEEKNRQLNNKLSKQKQSRTYK